MVLVSRKGYFYPLSPLMPKDSAQKLKKALKNAQNIIIVTHWSPDGDAMGSSLGLYHFLLKMGKKAKVIVPNEYPEFLDWLPGSKKVINFQKQEKKGRALIKKCDLIFTLDFNSFKRLETLGELISACKIPTILIDHHQQPDDYPTYFYNDDKACSTCELIYDFIAALGKTSLVDRNIAACLYTGLMTDTGSFRYPSVSSRTHEVLAALLKTGIQPSEIHSAVYDSYSLERLKLLGYALSEKLTITPDYPVAYFSLSEKELQRFNYKKGDTEGLVNYPFSIKGIRVCALFTEADNQVKISLRSKGKLDVNKFARAHFSGGGHINAAGGKSNLSLKETETKFVQLVASLF
jgi:bifunctional oligoribonuclease and PAP phosphatase NrnA